MPTQTQSEGSSGRFYWADGQKIPLTPSTHFVAVKGTGDEGAAAAAAARTLLSTQSPMTQNLEVLQLPEYGLAVVASAEGGLEQPATLKGKKRAEGVVGGLQALVAEERGLKVGPTIYETESTGPMTALIPVGEVIVRVVDGTTEDQRKRLFARHKLTVKQADHPLPGCYLLKTKGNQDPINVANALQENDLVEHAEPAFVTLTPRLDQLVDPGVFPAETPPELLQAPLLHQAMEQMEEAGDDLAAEDFATLAGPAADPGFASQWNLQKIRAPQAWAITQGTPSISIAVLDEGCDLSHEDIHYKLPGYDAYAGDNNPQPTGNDAHGTACAGVAAMRKDNGKGGVGVAPGSRIVPVRIAKGVGGGFWDTSSIKVADGIIKAVQAPRRADVLSNSYRVQPSSIVTAAFNYARTHGRGGKGACIAAAAGNADTPPVSYPARLSASIPGMMAVSATNQWDQRKSKTSLDGEWWWGSSFGPEVDIAAPGVKIYAPDITGASGYAGGSYVPNFNGTSSATPHVAGLMALILSVDPQLRSWEVEDIIKLTADDLGPAGRDQEFGFGRINCRRALEAASRIWYQITVQPVFLGRGRDCYMRANIRMYNPGINTVRLDALTMRSFTSNWATEIDRWEYRPRPGNVLRPRTGDHALFRRVLLKANGNIRSYSYRWSLNWSYTFWRPSAPGFSLSVMDENALTESEANQVTAQPVRGVGDSSNAPAATAQQDAAELGTNGQTAAYTNGHTHGFTADVAGDTVTIDRDSKAITVVIR